MKKDASWLIADATTMRKSLRDAVSKSHATKDELPMCNI